MDRTLPRRGVVGIAAAALACSSLMAPSPASAAILVGEVATTATFLDGGDCEVDEAVSPPAKELLDNGVPVTQSLEASATADTVIGFDAVDLSASARLRAVATPIGAKPSTIKASGTASASAIQVGDGSGCAGATVLLDATAKLAFNLPKPMWAMVRGSGKGTGGGLVELRTVAAGLTMSLGFESSGTATARVPAGLTSIVMGFVMGAAPAGPLVNEQTFTGSFEVQLVPMGHPSAVAGKARRYVKLGGRDCDSGKVDAALTAKVKQKAKRVVIKVNGKTVKTFKGKQLKQRSTRLPAARSSKADVSATVTLKSGAKVDVTRSYLAC